MADLSEQTRELLDDAAAHIRRYVALNPHALAAEALWALATWAADAFDIFGYLHVNSPEKRSGKTRDLEILSLLVARPWLTGRVTAAVLVRKLAKTNSTLLLDEIDSALRSGDEYAEALRGVLNTGYRRGGVTSLCVGQGSTLDFKDFSVFGFKAFAGIGQLPDTVADRSIPIAVRRRRPDENVARWRWRDAEGETATFRARATQWAVQATDTLQAACPDVPELLHDRAAEIWEPLFAVADLAGAEWPMRARGAALALHLDPSQEETLGILLLGTMRELFEGVDRLPTADLLRFLVDRDDGPWAEWWGRAVAVGELKSPAHRLARLLKPYGIRSQQLWIGQGNLRGYLREDCEDAFTRYLPLQKNAMNATTLDSAPVPDADPSVLVSLASFKEGDGHAAFIQTAKDLFGGTVRGQGKFVQPYQERKP